MAGKRVWVPPGLVASLQVLFFWSFFVLLDSRARPNCSGRSLCGWYASIGVGVESRCHFLFSTGTCTGFAQGFEQGSASRARWMSSVLLLTALVFTTGHEATRVRVDLHPHFLRSAPPGYYVMLLYILPLGCSGARVRTC